MGLFRGHCPEFSRRTGNQWVIASVRDITEHKHREEEHTSHIRFLESLELVDRVIKQETDVEQMLWHIVNKVFSIFNCDRAWLLYPCNPNAPSFRVPVEITKPEYPGAKFLNIDVPMSPGKLRICGKLWSRTAR